VEPGGPRRTPRDLRRRARQEREYRFERINVLAREKGKRRTGSPAAAVGDEEPQIELVL
jgi:hypothetical protein